jgi:hypothetical protein
MLRAKLELSLLPFNRQLLNISIIKHTDYVGWVRTYWMLGATGQRFTQDFAIMITQSCSTDDRIYFGSHNFPREFCHHPSMNVDTHG